MKRTWYVLILLFLVAGMLVPAAAAQGTPPSEEPVEETAVDLSDTVSPDAGIEGVSWRYTFYSSTLSYTPIVSGTVHGTPSNDDQSFAAIPLGFTFTYDGVDYTQASIQSNGFIAMGPSVSSSYYPLSTGTSNNVISALGRDIQGNGTTSELRSETIGTAPNRVFVVQWTDYKRYGATYIGDYFDFQIRLYETTNWVEVVYGPFTVLYVASPPYGPQVGLRGPSNADFNNRKTDATHFWANSLPGTVNTDSMALTDVIFPPNGLSYRWDFTTGVFVDPPQQSGGACRGSDVVYTMAVFNQTGVAQSFSLSYTSTWPVSGIPGATGVIPNMGSELITATVHVPWASGYNDSDVLTVVATGGGYTGQGTATTVSALGADWNDYANVPLGREVRAPSVVYWDGKLYMIGGYGYVGGTGAARAWLSIYDIATDTWTTGADMPGARYWLDCEAINYNGPKIYCAGGYLTSAQSTLYIYDITSNTWSTGAALPAARYSYASGQLGGKYYVIGGYTTSYQATMIVYDPATDTWDSTLASMNTTRRYHMAGVIGGEIYVAGGYNPSYLSSAEVYDPVANTWTYVASMPMPWLNAADGVKHDRFLVLAGGSPSSTSGASNGALVYDAQTDTWDWLPLLDHLLYSAEGDTDGDGEFWYASGRLYEGAAWSNSPYTTKLAQCEDCTPVYGADFTVDPPSPRPGIPATFSGSVAGGSPPITWDWDFGDGNYGSGQVLDHTYVATGTYTVVMTATNCDGANWSVATHDVVVEAGALIIVDPLALESTQCPDSLLDYGLSICNEGDQALVYTLTEVPALPWLNENPTGGTVPASQCATVTVGFDSTGYAPGTYTGTLRIDNNDTLNPVVDVAVTLTVAGPPTDADFTWDPPAPWVNEPVTFNGSANALLPIDYAWDFGDGGTGSGQNPTHAYTTWGTFTVVMTATECGQTDVATHDVVVAPCWSVVQEDFESPFPPAGWTVLNNGGNCVWQRNDFFATPRPNYAGGQGYCADADSDRCGSGTTMDTELRTMVLDLTGLTTATLRYVAAYNDIGTGGDFADTDISLDGGITWMNLVHWDADHSAYGPGELVELNLTPYAGQDDVMVRFHYYTATYDWWFEVDQVSVSGCYVPDAAPDINVTPISLTQTLQRNLVAEQLLNIANDGLLALHYTLDEGCGTPVDWLALDPLTGTVPAQSDTDVTVTFDSTGLATGIYTSSVCVNSDDPVEPTVEVTVTLVVLETPEITVDPTALHADQCTDEVTTQTLRICNVGDAPLDWSLREMPRSVQQGAFPPFVSAPVAERPVITSPEQCAAYENYTGAEPIGAAEFCHPDIVPVQFAGPAPAAPTDIGYALEMYSTDNVVRFVLNDFPGQTVVGPNSTPFYGMDFDVQATTLYALNDTTDYLGTISLVDGSFTPLVPCPPGGGAANWTGLTIDPVDGTFYGSTSTNLYIIDPATGNSTLVGPFNASVMIDIAMNMDGQMYGHDIGTDAIYSIDPATGQATLIGPTGYLANYAQGMDFDNDDGTLYIFLYQGTGANVYGTVNLQTGQVTPLAVSNPLGEFEGAIQIPGFTDIPWLSEDPVSGTVPAGECTTVTVTFDSTGLTPGDYYADLLIDSNDPANPQVVVPVTLTVEPPADLELTAPPLDVEVCADAMMTLTMDLCNVGGCSLDWIITDTAGWLSEDPTAGSLGADECITVSVVFDATGMDAGVYTASLVLESNDPDTPTIALPVTMTVNPVPEAFFDYDPISGTAPLTVYFTNTSMYAISPTWDFGDGSPVEMGDFVTHTYDVAGDYTATLTVESMYGCRSDAASAMVQVASGCVEPGGADFTWMPITPTAGATVDFYGSIVSGTAPLTYTWDFGDGGQASGQNVTHVFAATGTYTVRMTVTNECGEDYAVHVVTVEGVCDPVHDADFSWIPPMPLIGEDVTFSGSATGTLPIAFAWDFGDGTTDSGASVVHAYAAAGDYTVVMTASNGCGEQVVSHVVHVAAECEAPAGVDFTFDPLTPAPGDTVNFFGSVLTGTSPLTFTWAFGDGGQASGMDVTHVFTAAGTYVVTLTVANPCGQDSAVHSVVVQTPMYYVYLPLVFKGYTAP